MPEFFEVKRIKKYLIESGILHDSIINIKFKNSGERILKNSSEECFKNYLLNNKICHVKTKAKYTLFVFTYGSFLIHYRFTGIPHVRGIPYGDRLKSIYSLPIINLNKKYIRFSIYFSSGLVLDYYDTRCLSHLHYSESFQTFEEYDHLKKLPKDLENYRMLSYDSFKSLYSRSKLDVKTFLLDQSKAPSGIGNYLANEICADAKISPWLLISSISNTDYINLCNGIRNVINFSKKTTDYDWFIVFNQSNCRKCSDKIIKVRHKKNSQSTFYCPTCQEK